MPDNRIVGFIPARYGSTRFPGKALADIQGKPMVWRTLLAAKQSQLLTRTVVLTDDQRIFNAVAERGGQVMLTPESCKNGTERIAHALEKIPCEIAVNIQGDEPLITGRQIDTAIKPLLTDNQVNISTLACPIKDEHELHDPSAVKVVRDLRGFALFFSRNVIPYEKYTEINFEEQEGNNPLWLKHIGLYVYQSEIVKAITRQDITPLESAEKLEQLRMLEMGYKIRVEIVPDGPVGVDTPDDLKKVNEIFRERKNKY